jgi:hypothetical protein
MGRRRGGEAAEETVVLKMDWSIEAKSGGTRAESRRGEVTETKTETETRKVNSVNVIERAAETVKGKDRERDKLRERAEDRLYGKNDRC